MVVFLRFNYVATKVIQMLLIYKIICNDEINIIYIILIISYVITLTNKH